MSGGMGDDPMIDAALAVAKTIPPAAWRRMVDTACVTFEKAVAPLTAATSGAGELIASHFDRLIGLEKINTAEVFRLASKRIAAAGRQPRREVNLRIITAAIEGSASENDPDLRELWANLIAKEFTAGGVHPVVPRVLAQLTPADAKTLSDLAGQPNRASEAFFKGRPRSASGTKVPPAIIKKFRRETLAHSVLLSLGLIEREGIQLVVSKLGEEFIAAVRPVRP